MPRLTQKWRPPLWLVLGGALAGTLVLSLIGLVALRFLGEELGFRQTAIVLALGIGGLTAFLGALLVRLLMRPIVSLASYASQVRNGAAVLPAPPEHYGTQELSAMGQSVLDMATTLQNRAATVRSYTDHVTHELKTPVTAIRAAAELLEDTMPDGSADRRIVAQILGAADQMQQQLDALRRIAAAREPMYNGQSDLMKVATALGPHYPTLSLRDAGAPTTVPLAEEGLTLILGHLFANAAQHGATEVVLDGDADADQVDVTVTDNGTGISGGNEAQVFDPFFTTRRDTGGTGMGLAIVAALLSAHGGDVSLLATDSGAAFRLRFTA